MSLEREARNSIMASVNARREEHEQRKKEHAEVMHEKVVEACPFQEGDIVFKINNEYGGWWTDDYDIKTVLFKGTVTGVLAPCCVTVAWQDTEWTPASSQMSCEMPQTDEPIEHCVDEQIENLYSTAAEAINEFVKELRKDLWAQAKAYADK